MPRSPFPGLTFSLVGVGRVGASLGQWLLAGGARLAGLARRDPDASAPSWLPDGIAVVAADQLDSQGQDLLLLAVPDDELPGVVATLATRKQAQVALHTSGSRGADALDALRRAGSAVGSLHPLRAFPRPLADWQGARETFWAVTGDPLAQALAERLARAWGGDPGTVADDSRPLYHLAATLAAGGTVTLLASALEIVEELALPAAVAQGYLELAQGAVAQIPEPSGGPRAPRRAAPTRRHAALTITGPVARGDRAYLGQLAALRRNLPELYPLVVLLSLEALRQRALASPLGARELQLDHDLRHLCADAGFLDPLKK